LVNLDALRAGSDIYAAETKVLRHHLAYTGPIVIDARTKPGFPKELIVRDDIAELVDRAGVNISDRFVGRNHRNS